MIEPIDENKVNEYLEDNKKRIGDSFSSTQPETVEIKEIIGGKKHRLSGSRWS